MRPSRECDYHGESVGFQQWKRPGLHESGGLDIEQRFDGPPAVCGPLSMVTPANPTIAKGTTVQLIATGTFSDGTTQERNLRRRGSEDCTTEVNRTSDFLKPCSPWRGAPSGSWSTVRPSGRKCAPSNRPARQTGAPEPASRVPVHISPRFSTA